MVLVRGGEVFAPEPLGRMDLLSLEGRIVHMAPHIRPRSLPFPDLLTLEAKGRMVLPGFVDAHIHAAGAGGEGGFQNRTPPARLTDLSMAGTTTFVGLLGTDSVTRSPVSLLADVRRLTREGLQGYIYTGAYWLKGATLTGSVRLDLVMVDEVLGCGEVAISDSRGADPDPADIARYAREVRVGALLAGKKGVLHLHMGDEDTGLDPVMEAVRRSHLPIGIFHPTHLNRNPGLMKASFEFLEAGGTVDITAGITPNPPHDTLPTAPAKAIKILLHSGAPPEHITMSSDANGSSPVFDDEGRLIHLDVVRPSAVLEAFQDLVLREGVPIDLALRFVSTNPASNLGLLKKGYLGIGSDADLLIMDDHLEIHAVLARGRPLVLQGRPVAFGTFERSEAARRPTASSYGPEARPPRSTAASFGMPVSEGVGTETTTGTSASSRGSSKGPASRMTDEMRSARTRPGSSSGRSGRSTRSRSGPPQRPSDR